jgi:hypothetical protein
MDSFELGMVALLAALIGFIVWVAVEDGKDMERQRQAFYSQCLPHRERYDCDMQWKTYETAHGAEIAASAAMGLAAGAAANSGTK